jgi:Fe-S cluster biosynthesis and repair protein YggX
MNDQTQRIAQFQKMANDDPNNELGHFSLGKAYLEAGRPGDAVPSLRRVIELRRSMSKAYQLLGEAYEKLGRRNEAVEIMMEGVKVSDELGDVMPRDTMVRLLESWGETPPKLKTSSAPSVQHQSGSNSSVAGFRCSRCGRPDSQLPKPPFKGPLGQRVFENVCSNCWREWIPTGTKVINELGLLLSSPSGQQAYDQYMQEFLQLEPHA